MERIIGSRSNFLRPTFLLMVAAGLVSLAAVACSSSEATSTPPPTSTPLPTATPNPLDGGVLAEFEVSGETFHLWTDSTVLIDQLRALENGESTASIPNGELLDGPGQGDHNAPWSWHLDPDTTRMADVTIEVCDGRPSFVEEDQDYWLNTVERFCPWNAELVSLEDLT